MIIRLFRKFTGMSLKVLAGQICLRLGTNLHQLRQRDMPYLYSHKKDQNTRALLLTHLGMSHFLLHSLVYMPHRRHGMLLEEPAWNLGQRYPLRNSLKCYYCTKVFIMTVSYRMFVKLACAISSTVFFFFKKNFWGPFFSFTYKSVLVEILVIRVATDVHVLDLTNANEQFLVCSSWFSFQPDVVYWLKRKFCFYYVQQWCPLPF